MIKLAPCEDCSPLPPNHFVKHPRKADILRSRLIDEIRWYNQVKKVPSANTQACDAVIRVLERTINDLDELTAPRGTRMAYGRVVDPSDPSGAISVIIHFNLRSVGWTDPITKMGKEIVVNQVLRMDSSEIPFTSLSKDDQDAIHEACALSL